MRSNKNKDCIFLTETGVKVLLSKSRKRNVSEVAAKIGITLDSVYVPCIERRLLDAIHVVFPGAFVEQYTIRGASGAEYRVDAYSAKYGIALECDEPGHRRQYQVDADNKRQADIDAVLTCRWIRTRSDNNDIETLETIRDIHKHIIQSMG